MMSGREPSPSGLVVIARDACGQIVTRLTSHRHLVGAMHTAQCVLRLKPDAVCVEVHAGERSPSDSLGKPLAAISREDLPMEQIRSPDELLLLSHFFGFAVSGHVPVATASTFCQEGFPFRVS